MRRMNELQRLVKRWNGVNCSDSIEVDPQQLEVVTQEKRGEINWIVG